MPTATIPTPSSSQPTPGHPTHENNDPSPEPPSLDTSVLKELARRSLVDALNSVNGPKTLVLDPVIAGPLGLVAEISLMKHQGVEKMFWLEPHALVASTINIMYFCRPTIKCIKIIADQIKSHLSQTSTSSQDQQRAISRHTYTLFLVPRVSTLVSRILEEEGVLGELTISSYELQFIPLDEDVISLEKEGIWREIWVDGDETALYDAAQALVTLQKVYGKFPRVLGKGDKAARLIRLLQTHLQTHPNDHTATPVAGSEKLDALIVIDRGVDMITPLLTQLTYEGLIDEIIGIKNGNVELPQSILASTSQNPTSTSTSTSTPSLPKDGKENKKKYQLSGLTSMDPLFPELRDLNFAHVGKKLSKVARRLEGDYRMGKDGGLKGKSVAQLKDFVGKLNGMQSEHQALKIHTGLSELLLPQTQTEVFNKSLEIQQNLLESYDIPSQLTAIEELINLNAPSSVILRLMALASLTSTASPGGGIKPAKTYDHLRREFLQSYGYHNIPVLLDLSTCGLIYSHQSGAHAPTQGSAASWSFSQIRKSLRLFVEDDGFENVDNAEFERPEDKDMSYIYSGYAPLSCRLVQCVVQKGGVLAPPTLLKSKNKDAENAEDAEVNLRVRAHPILGWKGFEDVVSGITGETVDMEISVGDEEVVMPATANRTTTVVFFLGGCTYTEISAIRWMAKQAQGRRYLIATTGIINGNSFVNLTRR